MNGLTEPNYIYESGPSRKRCNKIKEKERFNENDVKRNAFKVTLFSRTKK